MLLGIVIEVSEEHPAKANRPILFTLLGMVIEVRLLILMHKSAGIYSTLSPIMKEVICERIL